MVSTKCVERMAKSEVFRYFKEARNNLEKRGETSTDVVAEIRHLDDKTMLGYQMNKPPGAEAFIIGDKLGGSGWLVPTHDGGTEMYYVSLPKSIAEVQILATDDLRSKFPSIAGRKMEELADEYSDFLEALVAEARKKFLPDLPSAPRLPQRPSHLRVVK
jgi:hypothetical protein